MRFPEDDEITPEEAQDRLSNIDREMATMADERSYLKRRAREPKLDPKDAKLVELAQNAGHAIGANEALANRIKFLEKRIKVRDEWIEEHKDYSNWKERALNAEAKLARKRKR